MPINGAKLKNPVALTELLKRGLKTKPDEEVIISLERSLTWRELDEAATRLAQNYLSLGLKPGDRIASLMPNRVPLYIHYLACIKGGFVGVPLNYRYMAPEIDHALEVSDASIIIAHYERMQDLVDSNYGDSLPLGKIIYAGEGERELTLENLTCSHNESRELIPPDPNSPAFIFFTSGSTGPAKGVTHTQESLKMMFASAAAAFEFSESDTLLPGSSISHLGGFMFSFAAISSGSCVLVAGRIDPDEIIPLLREYKPTVMCMIPAALFRVIRAHGARKEDFSSLRLFRVGADVVPLELEKEFEDLTGLVLDEGYGSSEMGLASLNPPSGQIKPGSVGIPVPGFTFSLRDDDGLEVSVGTDGNLWVKSNSLMSGYWERPDATVEVIVDQWFDTGDVLTADQDGYLHFRSRKKQIIVHDGSNISPIEVEESLLEHEAVEFAGAVGVHDLMHGENVRAFITIKEGEEAPPIMELIKFSRERIGYKAPEDIVILEEMPLNPTGKIDRVGLKRLAEEEHGHR